MTLNKDDRNTPFPPCSRRSMETTHFQESQEPRFRFVLPRSISCMFFPESPETASRRAFTVVACAPFRALPCVLGGFPYNDQTQTSLHVNSSSYITYTPLSACARPLFQVSGLHTVPRGSVKRASRFSIAISLIQ